MMESLFESDFESLIESDFESDFEYDEYDEWDERAPRRKKPTSFRPGLKTAPRGNATVRAPKSGFATKAELDATAKKLDGRIATNATAIKTLDRRTQTAEREVSSMGNALRKEIALRKKETGELRKGLDESRQIAMLMPLLGGGGEGDKLTKMLPVMMYGGMLGGGTGSSTSSDNNMMMTMMMVLALSD